MSSYDELLAQAKARGQGTAQEYIPKLYEILVNDEGKDPYDARGIIEHDLIDTWARATIRKHLPEEVKNEDKVKAGKKTAENKKAKILLTTSGAGISSSDEKEANSGSYDGSNYQKENNNVPSFSTALDVKQEPDDFKFKKEEYPPLNINEDLKTEIERLKEINDRYSTELTELRQAVTKTSFKPATEVKSFSFNDLPNADNMNTFSYQNIELATFRMQLGQLAMPKTNWNIWMERTK